MESSFLPSSSPQGASAAQPERDTGRAADAKRSYEPGRIEHQARQRWLADASTAPANAGVPYVCQAQFAELDGKLHLGHCRRYLLSDVMARYQRMQGRNVRQTVGFEAFGLQVHLAARDADVVPGQWVAQAAQRARALLERLGIAADWQQAVITCEPGQSQAQQELFLRLWSAENSPIMRAKHDGVAYWDPGTRLFLSLRQLVNGRGPESGMLVEIRHITTYALAIDRQLADDLLQGLEKLPRWDRRVRNMQYESIGREDGLTIPFALVDHQGRRQPTLHVFTSHPDTLMGTTFLAVAATHPLAGKVARETPSIAQFCAQVNEPGYAIEKLAEDKRQEGMPLGVYAIHPLTGDHLPVWVANFVIADYGTSAVLGIPAHDQRSYNFAQRHNLPMRIVALDAGRELAAPLTKPIIDKYAPVHNSGPLEAPLNALKERLAYELAARRRRDDDAAGKLAWQRYVDQRFNACVRDQLAKRGINAKEHAVARLRTWPISQPDYWGCPVPLIHCPACGTVPVPADQLPVLLPEYRRGQDNLGDYPEFVACKCPACAANAKRETDTIDPSFSLLGQLLPEQSANGAEPSVDFHCCGAEHATSRLLCARILRHACGGGSEPYRELLSPGMVMNYGLPMAKSYANAIEPAQLLDECGADLLRLYLASSENPHNDLHWDTVKFMSLRGIITAGELADLRQGKLSGLRYDLIKNMLSASEINRLQHGLFNRCQFKRLQHSSLEPSQLEQAGQLAGTGALKRLQDGLLDEEELRLLRGGQLPTAALNQALKIIDEFQLYHLQHGLLDKHGFQLLQANKLPKDKLAAVSKHLPDGLIAKLQQHPIDIAKPGAVAKLQKSLLDQNERKGYKEYASELKLLRKVRGIVTEDELNGLQRGLLDRDEFAQLRAGTLDAAKLAQVRKILSPSELRRLQRGLLSRAEMLQLKTGQLAKQRLHAVLEIIDERQVKKLQQGVLSRTEHERLRSILGSSRKLAQLRANTLSADKMQQIRKLFSASKLHSYQQACLSPATMEKLANFISTAKMNRLVNFVADDKQTKLERLLSAEQLARLRSGAFGKPRRRPLLNFVDRGDEDRLLRYLDRPSLDKLQNYLPTERMMQLLGFAEHLWWLIDARQEAIASGRQLGTKPQDPRRARVHKCLLGITACYGAAGPAPAAFELNKAFTRIKELIGIVDEACDPQDPADCAVAAEAAAILLQALHPIMPHITEELWSLLQMPGLLAQTPWPAADADAVAGGVDLTCVVQENGRKRHAFSIPASTSDAEAAKLALAELDTLAQRHGQHGFLGLGKQIVRTEHARSQEQLVVNFVIYLHQ